jgi:8-oxo-dGTP pyrophosphatase MutT (NUDIX family)
MTPADQQPTPLIPAATVVPLRDGRAGLETLLLRRNTKLEFAGGMWVWPGGRIDPADRDPADPGDLESAARRAAVREAAEEAALVLDPETLVWFSHWTPPPISPKRFATFFFAAPAPSTDITVDGGEIHEHRWFAPADALRRRDEREIELSPPTWITLEHLRAFATVEEALHRFRSRGPEYFATRFASVEGGGVALYDGDAGYQTGQADVPGARHRLWMMPDGWRYERS